MKQYLLVMMALMVTISCARSQEKVEALYQEHCAICHGQNLDGGLGGSLIDGEWRHGGSSEAIFTSIAKGRPDMDMPAFEETLNSQQVRALVIYIREKESQAADRAAKLPRADVGKVVATQYHSYKLEEVVANGLKLPWGMAFLPDGRMLVTERPGAVRIVSADGQLQAEPISGTPDVLHHGQGGMMEVAIDPDHAENGWIYLGFTDPLDGGGKRCQTAIVRGKLRGNQWVDEQWLWRADDQFYTTSGVHFGTRIVFHDGYMFFIVGERGGGTQVQELWRPNGKVYRLFPDGRVPDDNPFVGRDRALPGIWTYGHRNPQGMAVDPRNGDIHITEHGPRGGDELNLLQPGGNYGWPLVTHGMNYNGTPITEKTQMEGVVPPLIHWTPSIAPCGLAFYTGDRFPQWKNDLFAGSLRNQTLRRLRIQDGKVVEQEVVLKGVGRIREVVTGPDGYLYVALNGPDRIVRLIPE